MDFLGGEQRFALPAAAAERLGETDTVSGQSRAFSSGSTMFDPAPTT